MILQLLLKFENCCQNYDVQTKPAEGSTFSLALVLLNRVDTQKANPQAVYVTCNFDAATQFHKMITRLGKETGVKCGLASHRNQGIDKFKLKTSNHMIVHNHCIFFFFPM